MYDAFKGTKQFLTRKPKIQQPRPDNFVFRLHYQFTFGLLGVAVVLITSYAYIDTSGSAIQCMTDKGIGVPEIVINRYCWIMSTFSLPKYYEGEKGKDFIHHGVGPMQEGDEQVYHAYYQWVPLFLSFQAIAFYVPHYIWKRLEGGRFRHIIAGLNSASASGADLDNLYNYLKQRMSPGSRGEHTWWAAKFYFCEILNFINVIVQIALTDHFLGGAFSSFGIEAASWSDQDAEDRMDPMIQVFPRMTKCTFHKFGGSGTIQKFDALCVLGMNIINEKVFVFLWFWYVTLAVITFINLVLRLGQFFLPGMRHRMIKISEFGLRSRRVAPGTLERVLDQLSYPDWLLLYYLAQSMDKANFARLINKMGDDNDEDQESDSLQSPDKRSDETDGTLKSQSPLKNFLTLRKNRPDV